MKFDSSRLPCWQVVTCFKALKVDFMIIHFIGLAVGTDRNQVGDPSLPAQLTVEYFISKSSLCQTMEYGVCWLLTAKGTEAGNCYRFTALSRFLTYDAKCIYFQWRLWFHSSYPEIGIWQALLKELALQECAIDWP